MPDVNGKSAGFIGYKARLYRSTDAGATYTQIPEVKSIDLFEATVEEAEFTHLESPGKVREYKATFKDLGNVAVTCNYLDVNLDAAGAAIQQDIIDDQGVSDNDFYWKAELRQNDDTAVLIKTVVFPAYIATAKPGTISTTDPVEFAFSLRVTGAATWT